MISITFSGTGASLPLWAQYAQIYGTWFVGLVGLAFVWRQYNLARTKVRLDLFDKRFKVTSSINGVLGIGLGSSVQDRPDASKKLLKRNFNGMDGYEYLFDKKVSGKIGEVRRLYAELIFEIENVQVGTSRWNKLSKDLHEAADVALESCRKTMTFRL